jgi:hypothetical protein
MGVVICGNRCVVSKVLKRSLSTVPVYALLYECGGILSKAGNGTYCAELCGSVRNFPTSSGNVHTDQGQLAINHGASHHDDTTYNNKTSYFKNVTDYWNTVSARWGTSQTPLLTVSRESYAYAYILSRLHTYIRNLQSLRPNQTR